jgi:hypothetical protein
MSLFILVIDCQILVLNIRGLGGHICKNFEYFYKGRIWWWAMSWISVLGRDIRGTFNIWFCEKNESILQGPQVWGENESLVTGN